MNGVVGSTSFFFRVSPSAVTQRTQTFGNALHVLVRGDFLDKGRRSLCDWVAIRLSVVLSGQLRNAGERLAFARHCMGRFSLIGGPPYLTIRWCRSSFEVSQHLASLRRTDGCSVVGPAAVDLVWRTHLYGRLFSKKQPLFLTYLKNYFRMAQTISGSALLAIAQ